MLAAVIALITALVPLLRWGWRTYGVRRFDAKKAHYNQLIEQAEWFEDRLVRLDTLRKQLLYAKIYDKPPDRFQLAELTSKLDPTDRAWAMKIEDPTVLAQACEREQEQCQRNAEQDREWAEEVGRKVLFW